MGDTGDVDEDGTTQHPRPSRTPALAAIGATVLAVVAALVLPSFLSGSAPSVPSVPQPPAPIREVDTPGSTTWHAVRCQPFEVHGCEDPKEIDHGGALFHTVGGSQQTVLKDSPGSRRLSVAVPASQHDRWVLVGAVGAGRDSSLNVVIGTLVEVSVPPGRLTLFALPGNDRVVVTISDLGFPRQGEVLHVQQYEPR